MIRFRQKSFILPAIPAILNGLMAAGTGVSILQGAKQGKQAEAAAAQAADDNRRMTKALNRLADKNPAAGAAAAEVMQKGYSMSGIARIAAKEARALGKVGTALTKKHQTKLVGGVLAGGAMGAASYAANKGVEIDMKRSGIPMSTSQKSFAATGSILKSISKAAKNTGKVVKTAAKEEKGMIALTAGLGALPVVAGYVGNKQAMKEQAQATQQRSYSKASLLAGMGKTVSKWGKGAAKGWTRFKDAPVKSTLSGLSNFAGGGGTKGVTNMGRSLTGLGKKHGSIVAEKTGNFITKNPKTALAASIPVGFGIYDATWGTGEKAVKKVARKLDKNAYAYQESQEKQVSE